MSIASRIDHASRPHHDAHEINPPSGPMKEETVSCAHDWQPIAGWCARYRCSICRVIGRKPGAVHPQRGRSTAIEPYRCEAKCGGARCTERAVHAWRGKNFRCAAHRHPGRTGGARRELGAADVGGAHEVASAAHEVSSGGHELVSRAHEVVSGAREVVSAAREVVSGAREVVSAAHEVSMNGHEPSSSTKGNA